MVERTIKCNKFNTGMFLIFNDIKIDSISLISEFNFQSNYNLIKLYDRDGYILDKNNSLNEITQNVVFYTDNLSLFSRVFEFTKETDIYFNNLDYFYRGFVSNIKTSKFKHRFYEVVISFVLQPFCFRNSRNITLSTNGTIINEGDFEARPTIEVVPNNDTFSISINGKTMRFDVGNYSREKFIIDLENYEIKNLRGELRNSIFTGGNYLKLDVGLNSVVLSGISEIVFKCNWRYLYYDISKKW